LLQAARATAANRVARTSDFFISGFLMGVNNFRKSSASAGMAQWD
jgi:hypothetical protein